MNEEDVSPQEPQELSEHVEQIEQANPEVSQEDRESNEERVPVSALQKMRRRAQEAEQALEYERTRRTQDAPVQEDLSRYESATKQDLHQIQQQTLRMAEEKFWQRQNPEKQEFVDANLAEFIKQRPNLFHAIESAPNRYEEAWTLMNALSPRQQKELKAPQIKKDAPNSPSAVPKAAGINQAIDVMSMSDEEFANWKRSKKKR